MKKTNSIIKRALSLVLTLTLVLASMNTAFAVVELVQPSIDITVDEVGANTADVSWIVTLPSSFSVDNYDYQLSGQSKVTGFLGTSTSFAGLMPGTEYSVTVDAHYSETDEFMASFELETTEVEVTFPKTVNIWRRNFNGLEYALETNANSTRYATEAEAIAAALAAGNIQYNSIISQSLAYSTNEGVGWEKSKDIEVVLGILETRYRVKYSSDDYNKDLSAVVSAKVATYELENPIVDNNGLVYTVTKTMTTMGTVSDTVTFKTPVNLWMAADDGARLYIDGAEKAGLLAPWNAPDNYKKANLFFIDELSNNPFLAAKAWDGHENGGTGNKTIAGFKMVLKVGEESFKTTNGTWYYYTGEGEPANDVQGNAWYKENYVAEANQWASVSVIANPNNAWAKPDQFPASGDYIWAPSYEHQGETLIHTPVYFRSGPPAAIPDEKHTLTLTYMQMARDPEALRTYRVFHKDLTNYGYDVKLGYRIAGNEGITELQPKLVYDTHTEGNRNAIGLQYLFTTGNKIGVDESETVILYWWNAAQEQWIQSQTKASSTLYSITYDANGGTLAEGESVKYAYTNDSITAPVPTRSGYSFDGWVYTPESFNPASVKSSATAIAQWTEDEFEQPENPVIIVQPTISTFVSVTNYSLTVNIEGEGTVPGFTGTNNFSSGTNVNLDPKPEEGFVFLGWEGDTETMTGNTIVMNGNKVITAVFGTLADDELELGDQEIAQAAPEEDADEETTDTQEESQPVVDESEVTILDGKAPQATATEETELPKTGGIPLEGLVFAGTALIGLGRKLRKR